ALDIIKERLDVASDDGAVGLVSESSDVAAHPQATKCSCRSTQTNRAIPRSCYRPPDRQAVSSASVHDRYAHEGRKARWMRKLGEHRQDRGAFGQEGLTVRSLGNHALDIIKERLDVASDDGAVGLVSESSDVAAHPQ
ncbi:hypothetical protein CTI14_41390, partial [Methylobacterium radiotolerans]